MPVKPETVKSEPGGGLEGTGGHTCRGMPYIRKSSLDHDSGGKNRGCQSVFQKYSTLLVFTSVTHTSPSLTASLAIIVPVHAHHFSRFQNLKNPSTLPYPYCRDLTIACASAYIHWSQTESTSKWSLNSLSSNLRHPFRTVRYEPPPTHLKSVRALSFFCESVVFIRRTS